MSKGPSKIFLGFVPQARNRKVPGSTPPCALSRLRAQVFCATQGGLKACLYACGARAAPRFHVCGHARMYVCLSVRMCVCMYARLSVCVHVCVYVCTCVCLYVWPPRHGFDTLDASALVDCFMSKAVAFLASNTVPEKRDHRNPREGDCDAPAPSCVHPRQPPKVFHEAAAPQPTPPDT